MSPCACIRRARRARCACATAATANALPRPHARTHAGLNNMQAGQKAVEILRKLDYLLAWAQAAWPHTKIMLVSLLPNAKYNTGALNKQYVALAAKRRLAWALCGQDINARDKAQLYDGTHPTVAAAQAAVLPRAARRSAGGREGGAVSRAGPTKYPAANLYLLLKDSSCRAAGFPHLSCA